MEDIILTDEQLKEDGLTAEDRDFIDKEMNEAIKETIEQVAKEIEEDEELDKETKEIFATEDINERIEIFKKYHPDDKRFG